LTTRRGRRERRSLYRRELRLSLRNNSGAYGFSVMITAVLAVVMAIHHPPSVGDLFLFVLGAVVSFAAIEFAATRGFRLSLSDTETSKVIALGSSLGIVSISTAVGVAALAALILPESLSWAAGSFLGSSVYLLVTALEMSVARRIEEARDLVGTRER